MGGIRKPKKDVIEKTWSSLSQLATHFKNSGEERVKDYDGIAVTTTKHRYTLAFGELHREILSKPRKQSKKIIEKSEKNAKKAV